MCYTEILIKENKLKKEEEIDAIIIVLCFLTVSISTRIQKKEEVIVMLLVKDFFGGKPGGNCSPDFDLEHDRIGIF